MNVKQLKSVFDAQEVILILVYDQLNVYEKTFIL